MNVCNAVSFAHSKGVMHRDLKPDNIMIGEYGEVYVMDWGLAALLPPHERPQQATDKVAALTGDTVGGTPAYLAPEMAAAEADVIGIRSDVYLLGAILYEIITGKPPHKGTTPLNCIYNAYRNIIEPTDESGELVDIALKAMATHPDEAVSASCRFPDRYS